MTGYPSIDQPWLKYYSKNAIDTPLLDGTIYECLKEKSTEYENLCAINYYGNRITYKQLLINIDKVASYFVSIGIKQGDYVTICMLNTPEMVYCAYALSKIGAIADFEYPTLAVEEMNRCMINNSSDTLVILSLFYDKYESVCKSIKNVILVNPEDSMSFINRTAFKMIKRQRTGKEFSLSIKNIKNLEEVKNCNSDGNKPVIMVHTGGTTGVPKGVLLSSNNLNFIACDYSVCGMEYRKGDSILHGIPPFHAYGFSIGIHMPLMLGFTIYMQIKVDDDSIAKSFFRCKPTHVETVACLQRVDM